MGASCHQGIRQAGWPTVEVEDQIEATAQKEQSVRLSANRQHFLDIGIAVEAVGESRFHQNGNAEAGKLSLERADRACEQKAVAH